MHFLKFHVDSERPSASISRNASMMWEEEAEKAFRIAPVMGLPSCGTDSLSAAHVAQKQPTGAHRLQSSQKNGVLYLQVLENGISCQHKKSKDFS